jgi:hypothetical protein
MHTLHYVIAAAGLAALVGCGANNNIAPPITGRELSMVTEDLPKYSAKLSELRAHPQAALARLELEQAAGWLEAATSLQTSDPGSSRVKLRLEAVKTQLVLVQSIYARHAAEDAAGKTPMQTASQTSGNEGESK